MECVRGMCSGNVFGECVRPPCLSLAAHQPVQKKPRDSYPFLQLYLHRN